MSTGHVFPENKDKENSGRDSIGDDHSRFKITRKKLRVIRRSDLTASKAIFKTQQKDLAERKKALEN